MTWWQQAALTVIPSVLTAWITARLTIAQHRHNRAFDRSIEWHEAAVTAVRRDLEEAASWTDRMENPYHWEMAVAVSDRVATAIPSIEMELERARVFAPQVQVLLHQLYDGFREVRRKGSPQDPRTYHDQATVLRVMEHVLVREHHYHFESRSASIVRRARNQIDRWKSRRAAAKVLRDPGRINAAGHLRSP